MNHLSRAKTNLFCLTSAILSKCQHIISWYWISTSLHHFFKGRKCFLKIQENILRVKYTIDIEIKNKLIMIKLFIVHLLQLFCGIIWQN